MNRYPEIGERVKVSDHTLPTSLKNYNVGEVISRNGDYVFIELDGCQIVIERYINEIDPESIH